MGIDIHVFNFVKRLSKQRSLGNVLTIGRQSLSLPNDYMTAQFSEFVINTDSYCELLLQAMGATDVASVDYSDYEGPTFVGDLSSKLDLGREFDTIIDSGSLEHVFDVASAFRNCIGFCKVGGRVIHILPVNNLSGHGFWQFNSDLIHSIYSEKNGFKDTVVYYASGINFSNWYKVPKPSPGSRVNVASVEPIILLSVSEKFRHVENLQVFQPFYARAWSETNASLEGSPPPHPIIGMFRTVLKRRGRIINLLRNAWFVVGLLTGNSRFSIQQFEKVPTGHDLDKKSI